MLLYIVMAYVSTSLALHRSRPLIPMFPPDRKVTPSAYGLVRKVGKEKGASTSGRDSVGIRTQAFPPLHPAVCFPVADPESSVWQTQCSWEDGEGGLRTKQGPIFQGLAITVTTQGAKP